MSGVPLVNLYAAWIGMLLGVVAGAIVGLFFHREDFLGGYGTWRRRMVRLGHIAWFGLAFVNLGFALSVRALEPLEGLVLPGGLLIAGAATMSPVCYLSAWRKPFRNLFFIPVVSVGGGIALFLWAALSR